MPEPLTIVGVVGGSAVVFTQLARHYFDLAKEVADILLGFVALAISSPLILACAILIKLSSKGPVFYSQTRLGLGGRSFRMYKLRTMHVDAESAHGARWACKDDPRIIPQCRWMRRSHVDELPQLINVIKGEMSLIGPRPERPEILRELEKTYPNVRNRLSVRPGITGLAQVRAGYDTTVEAFRSKLQADLEYIERRRWGTELRIFAATLLKFNDKTAH